MKRILYISSLICLLSGSCMTMDMREVQKVQSDHDDRIRFLEEWVGGLNEEIRNLQQIVRAIEGKDYITSVTETQEGVTISFKYADPITILHGEQGEQGPDGEAGQNGQNGTDGVDGNNGLNGTDAPAMGVRKEKGNYYWTITINGHTELLNDKDGHPIPVTGEKGEQGDAGRPGTNGKPGVTPTLSISLNGNWAINNQEILVAGKPIPATGPEGDKGPDGQPGQGGNGAESSTYFKSVDVSKNGYVTFKLKDGSNFTLPICQEITFNLEDNDFSYRMRSGKTHTLTYNGKGIHHVTANISEGWHISLDTTRKQITITAPSDKNFTAVEESTLSILVSNTQGQQIVINRKIHLILQSYRIDLTTCNSLKSDVYLVKNAANIPVAEICLEYVKGFTETTRQRTLVVYPWDPVKEEYATGYVVTNGGRVNHDGTGYIANNLPPCTSVSIDILGRFVPIAEATSTLTPATDIVTDFDNNIYGIVKIGNQYWMKENFRNTRFRNADGTFEALKNPTQYDSYEPGSEATFSWLYDYAKIFRNKPKDQHFLPEGWHLPKSREINELITFIPRAQDLRANSNAWTSAPGNENTNLSGFGALPGGFINRNLSSHPHAGLHTSAEYWSSSEQNGVNNPVLKIDYNTNNYTITLPYNYAEQRSIRCIRDNWKQ